MEYSYSINEGSLTVYTHHPEWEDVKGTDLYVNHIASAYTDGSSWTDQQATEWAELYIASLVDPKAPYAPINSDSTGQPKASKLEQTLWELELKSRQVTDVSY
jgi:hypothetical protein